MQSVRTKTRADKAREVIDTVRRKGTKAFQRADVNLKIKQEAVEYKSFDVSSSTESTSDCRQTSNKKKEKMDPVGSVKTEMKTEKQASSLKSTESSKTSKPGGLTVYSIKEVKSFCDKTEVSVKGNVTKINHVEKIEVKFTKKKRKRQRFQLKDETDSIDIFMWGDETEQCNGLSVGDVVKVTNMKTNKYYENILLNSTVHTRIEKMDPVGSVKTEMKTEKQASSLKSTESSKTSKPGGLTVYSIKEVKSFCDKTEVSVKGNATEGEFKPEKLLTSYEMNRDHKTF
ncbi:uncharacterized protein LOC144528171 [Sander vitreus]